MTTFKLDTIFLCFILKGKKSDVSKLVESLFTPNNE